jgi:streptomycin 6-kinase
MRVPSFVPEAFARTIVEVFQDNGVAWLEHLPSTIAHCERRWSLVAAPPVPNLSYNYVAPAIRSDGTAVILKLGVPNREFGTEIAALRLYDGRGCGRLLDADEERGLMLLERLAPGTPLADLADDEAATAVAAEVMRQLWRPAPPEHPFPTVAGWAAGMQRLRAEFDGGAGPFPPGLIDKAERLFAELLGSMETPVLLHGDLHHWNILAAERHPWLAIDPKGVVGEPAYEVGALLRNKLDIAPDISRLTARRIDQLAEALGFDRQRLLAWCLAQAVLSAWWSYEDHGSGWEEMVEFAQMLDGLMG